MGAHESWVLPERGHCCRQEGQVRGGTYHDDNQSSNGDHASVMVIAALDVRMRSILRAKSCRDVVVVVGGGAHLTSTM